MKINESKLRIGNLVEDPKGSTHKIERTAVDTNRERFGITLTGEWLVRFGAKKINNSMYRMGAFTFQSYSDMSLEAISNRNIRSGFRICFCGKFLTNAFYVHRWQNIYHSISDKELTIQP